MMHNIDTFKSDNLETRIQMLIKQLTLEEKIGLCSGKNFWQTQNIDRLEIPSIWLSDGPYGLRKVSKQGFSESTPATCFPTLSALAASWNTEMLCGIGQALGKECLNQDIQILLGPGVNIKRSPLGGRNFEYFSEDPVLAGELASAFINGVQSQGVGTSLKHFSCNNSEYDRMRISVNLDERSLREIYLTAFEIAVKKAHPWTVMASYNRVNSVHATENRYLLTDILRNEWGFKGVIISDWGAVNNRVNSLKAGLDIEMPNNPINNQKILQAVKDNELPETELDNLVYRILRVILMAEHFKRSDISINREDHHDLARHAAEESIVLLKNSDNILPLNKYESKKIAVIGLFAKQIRFQGEGSARVRPTQLDNAYDEIVKAACEAEIVYAPGYSGEDLEVPGLIEEAVHVASKSDIALVFAGLPDNYEAEAYDREHMQLPHSHSELIKAVAEVQPDTVVVLLNGSPVDMSTWYMKVKGIIEAWLSGQAGGSAIANILFGDVNPSGKLPETFPCRLEDNPSFLNFPGNEREVNYNEGIFVGYRYYDKVNREVLFPFGFGLSYTCFEYGDLKINKKRLSEKERLIVTLKIKNRGDRFGKEVVQLYVRDKECYLTRPDKELKCFAKISLNAGVTEEVRFVLERRDFAFFDAGKMQWVLESGEFDILVGSSSRDIRLTETVFIESTDIQIPRIDSQWTLTELSAYEKLTPMVEKFKNHMIFGDATHDFIMKDNTLYNTIVNLPLRRFINFNSGKFTEERLNEFLEELNSEIQR